VLYGVGARLDEQPDLLFRLRAVEGAELVAGATADLTLAAGAPAADRVLRDDDMAALFGLDMASPAAPAAPAKPNAKPPVARPPRGRAQAPKAAPPAAATTAKTARGARAGAKAAVPSGANSRKSVAAAAADGRGSGAAGARASTASAKPAGKARKPSSVGSTAAAGRTIVDLPKASDEKAATQAQREQSPSKSPRAARATPNGSSIPVSKVAPGTGTAVTTRAPARRDRAEWSWKARAAARKAKRKA
jgi:hypothetical protein